MNEYRGRPKFSLPDYGERIEHVRRLVEHEINARDDPFANTADKLVKETLALERKAIEDAKREGICSDIKTHFKD